MMCLNHLDMFRDKPYGGKFWSGGYFVRTVGAVNADTVKRYVEESQEYRVEIKTQAENFDSVQDLSVNARHFI